MFICKSMAYTDWLLFSLPTMQTRTYKKPALTGQQTIKKFYPGTDKTFNYHSLMCS
uniref:Uncharacterized protein n=1 Tax=Rhizophora mucronata TaxID=61149 RepID=A0A2P2PNW3_RHIMU